MCCELFPPSAAKARPEDSAFSAFSVFSVLLILSSRLLSILRRGRRLEVDAALQLVGTGPASGTFLLVRRDRPRARHAADRAVPGLVQRVVRDLVHGDVGPDALLVPVRERM